MSIAIQEVPQALKKIFSEVLRVGPDDISPTSSTKTLRHWDSLRHVELVVAIEETFGVSFSAAEVFGLTSVQGFCDMLARKNVNLQAP